MTTQSQTIDTEVAPAAPELTITDLQNLRAIIDAAVRRGAFGAAEVSSVGAAFDRLNAFVVAVTPAEEVAEVTPVV